MRILCVNDDGIHAPGLSVLEGVARALSQDVWVVAPETEQSGASRALTLTQPIRVREAAPRRFAVTGTPTDCVQLALHELIEGPRPDVVLSGVNRGQNIAEDVTFSGTIAAAMQGMQLGIPSIALSQAGSGEEGTPFSFQPAEQHARAIVQGLLGLRWPPDVVMNVNFPARVRGDRPEVRVTRQGLRDQNVLFADRRTDLRGNAYFWLGYRPKASNPPEGTDLHAIHNGHISVTPLHVDLTHFETIEAVRRALENA
jgi:5'-nucleotidase